MSNLTSWRELSVDDLCLRVTSGGTPKRTVPEYYSPATIPWVKTGDLLDTYVSSYSEYISDRGLQESSAKILPADTVLMAMYGATVGALGILSEEATCNQASCALITDPEVCNPRWLFYALLNGRNYIVSQATGAAQQNLSGKTIRQFRFLTPPISEQRAIAEVLGALDDKIAANNKTIQLADSLTSALAEDAFSRGNFVPLASIAEITMGNSPKGETLNEDGEGLAFFQGIRDFGVRYPQERVSSTAPTRFAKELDTLFSVRAPVGTVNLAGMPCSIGRGISALSSKTETPYALFQAVRASKIWERYNAEGTVFGSINRKQLEQSEIPWVFHSERYELESTLAGLERLLRTATVMNETLSSIRDTLLPQLMSGKLRVREAEAVVEDVL